MTHQVVDGAFRPEHTDKPRHIVGDRVIFTVEPPGKTACFAQTGLKMPFGNAAPASPRKVVQFCGQIDGVRGYVTERDGKVHVILTKRELKP